MKELIEKLQTLVNESDLIVFNGKYNISYFEDPILEYKDEHKKSPLYPHKTIWLSCKNRNSVGSLLICNESHFSDELKINHVKSLLVKLHGYKSV
jgi:hypothetical protein